MSQSRQQEGRGDWRGRSAAAASESKALDGHGSCLPVSSPGGAGCRALRVKAGRLFNTTPCHHHEPHSTPTRCSPGLDLLPALSSLQPSEAGPHFTDGRPRLRSARIHPTPCPSLRGSTDLTSTSIPTSEPDGGLPRRGTGGKESVCQRRDTGSIPGLERSPGRQSDSSPVHPGLSPRAATTAGLERSEPVLQHERRSRPTAREWPPLATAREEPGPRPGGGALTISMDESWVEPYGEGGGSSGRRGDG